MAIDKVLALGGSVLSFVFCCASSAMPTQQGLVAHYPFDEGSGAVVRDASGNGHDGAVHGAKYIKLQEGFALEFDGVDDYVEIPASDKLKLADTLTVEAWINTRVTSSGGVISKNGCSTLRHNYSLRVQGGGALCELVECPDVEKGVRSSPITPDKWYHLVGTYDGEDISIYVNGELSGANPAGKFTVGTFDGPLYIGGNYYGIKLGYRFAGQIDDVRIYDYALTKQDILANYQAGKDTRISKLTAMLKQRGSFREADTTPPTISLPSPPADSTAGPDAVISVKFGDAGSGIDLSSARILLDGQDLTSAAKVSTNGFALQPATALAKGVHRVVATVADKAGNRGNRLSWIFGVDTPVLVEAKFENGVFLVSGEPYFPVGVYGDSISPGREHLGYMAQASEAGINHQLVGQWMGQEDLDTYLKHGIKLLIVVSYASADLAKGDATQLDNVLKVKNHPAILAWWTEYSSSTKEHIVVPTYKHIKEKDPRHPVLFMHTWAGRFSDVYYVYAYPILNPLQTTSDVISLYNTIVKPAFEAAAAEGKGKPVWFISQAFDYRALSRRGEVTTLEGGFRPSREEIRAMNYLALAKGVTGLLFYSLGADIAGTEYFDDLAVQERQWTEALKIAREVRHLTPVLTAGQRAETVRLQEEAPAIHYRELVRDGVHTLIAVNVERDLVLGKWIFDTPSQPKVLFEDRVLSEKGSSITDLFEPLEVHIYQWKPTTAAQ